MTTRPKIVDELKAGLEGVTPGPYVFSGVRYKMNGGEWQNMFDGQDRAIIAVSINPRTLEGYKDGCHIARCSPDNISALIEWGESMERERDALRSALDLKSSNYAVQTVDLRSAVTRAEAAEAKVAELEAKLAARDDEEAELLSIAAMYGQKRGMDGLRELKAENERLRAAHRTLPDYDAGLLSDYGGGNVAWWHDYLRAEIGRANDHWRTALAGRRP